MNTNAESVNMFALFNGKHVIVQAFGGFPEFLGIA
jgi:hypothetical protein